MKKILLLNMVCFSLFGCDSNKVTKEYLVGEWDCVNKEYESKYDPKSAGFSKYTELYSNHVIRSYKIVNEVLLTKIIDEDEDEEKLDLDEFYKNLEVKDKIEDCEYIITRSLLKNSSNKFTFEIEMIVNCSEKDNPVNKFKVKRKAICTRIK